ncbi:MAG: shikimate dehydrogenase [Acidobacteriota bacterium]|nr:shikimate dehydrogenase [Acidobacteriota bacterium]
MNNGRICVSVCAKTADELIKQIKRAEEFADVIEVRFDCLHKGEFHCDDPDQLEAVLTLVFANDHKVPLISTFRTKEQGGERILTNEQRDNFWNMGFDHEWADLEEDVIEESFYWLWEKRICSFHDFSGVPDNLEKIYNRLKATDADVVKIAIQAHDITDSIPLWKLLNKVKREKQRKLDSLKLWNLSEHAKADNNEIIPIAMGEAGKWTRILGLAHGAFMTYASLESGSETAPGQISAKDLIEVYRVKQLNENTSVYGIIGGNTGYSVSPFIHNAAFKKCKLNSVFLPLQVKNLDEFMRRMVKPATRGVELNFAGFSVTIPHKQTIIKHLDSMDETAKKIGAVNMVKIENGKLYGFNTDAHGFIEPLKKAFGDLRHARVAVFGAGGAARACIYALKLEGAEVSLFARDLQKADKLVSDFGISIQQLTTDNRQLTTGFDIIVNATPLGTKGELENETIATAENLRGVKLIYDLIYNPIETLLISEAKQAGVPTLNGLEMLIGQGAKQFEIWNGNDAPVKVMRTAVLERLF